MRCTVCGADLQAVRTDLPFKVVGRSIVVLKGLPVMQCGGCPEYLIEDDVLRQVDEILARVDTKVELEIVHYAA
ncbi:MAG: YgiT-type zinc finger domain-containing protein [Candidatus Tectomicrobia bacterium RIFCSPLOWO2_12_FULL_69_37]|nr:MAG: YgiT-type zinc finger domain-containing protein [Candidatus Tectomicrobia bacterium RIFCSPLOWO2_02_FULL_70_19]OGL67617.1 MAG: YgiT-type zinc finger domain-containing protein [Candidatus Tectomicrobia bacterium RIFCSPLOWO2_12_FULL_69_37]